MDISIVALDQIQIPPRKRPLDPAAVQALAASIERAGLIHPIRVTAEHRLMLGHHPLEAVRTLGWHEIPAIVHSGDELEAALAEIDENLVRSPLRPLEMAEQLAERDRILQALG